MLCLMILCYVWGELVIKTYIGNNSILNEAAIYGFSGQSIGIALQCPNIELYCEVKVEA